jgi:hypothetical protein
MEAYVKNAGTAPPPGAPVQGCYIVRDVNGHAPAYIYFEDEPGRRAAAGLLTRDGGSTRPTIPKPKSLVRSAEWSIIVRMGVSCRQCCRPENFH